MAIVGVNDLKQLALPTGWDAILLSKLQLADGTTYDQLLNDVSAALSMANARLLSNPIYAGLVGVGTTAGVEYPVGVSNGFEQHTEYGLPNPKRAITSGHMLEPVDQDRGLGWTRDGLEAMRMAQVEVNIASAIQDLESLFQKQLLTRLFKSTYTAVGTAGKSMPLADGGTADSTWIPWHDPNRAAAFAYTHDHIVNLNGITQANIETAVGNLWEHGFDAPYDLLAAEADLASWVNTTNVTGFVKRADGLIRYGNTADLATVDNSYQGVIETSYGPVRLRTTARIPTTYWTLYKSYGNLDARNPLRIAPFSIGGRTYPLGAYLSPGPENNPLVSAYLRSRWWVGIGERREAAVVVINSGGGYSDPTIL